MVVSGRIGESGFRRVVEPAIVDLRCTVALRSGRGPLFYWAADSAKEKRAQVQKDGRLDWLRAVRDQGSDEPFCVHVFAIPEHPANIGPVFGNDTEADLRRAGPGESATDWSVN